MKCISLDFDDIKLAKYFTNQRIKINFKGMSYINLNKDFTEIKNVDVYTLYLNWIEVTDISAYNIKIVDINKLK